MPRYRVTEQSFIGNRLVPAGETVDYDGLPGTNLEPLDDEAKAAKSVGRPKPAPGMAKVQLTAEQRALVEIPDDWREWGKMQRIGLARDLGAPVAGTNAEAADKFIERELANREII